MAINDVAFNHKIRTPKRVQNFVTGQHAPGIYHLVNEGPGVTWYGFAREFFELRGVTTPSKPVPMSAFPRPAPRPLHARLLNAKFPPLPQRLDALRRFFAETDEKNGS